MDFDRDPVVIDLAEHVRILFRSGGRPIDHYAVMLQLEVNGEWCTVRLIDNHLDHHHMHRYHGREQGQPEHFAHGTVNEVIPQAIRYMRDHFQPIIDSMDPRVTAANRVATDAAIAAILADEDRYPGGAAFVGEDHPAFDAIVARHVHAGEAFVVVAADGSETLYAPTHA